MNVSRVPASLAEPANVIDEFSSAVYGPPAPASGSAFTTAAGFGILVTSTLKPFQQLGEVTFWAITFALVASVLVLPSMLVVWDRWHRRRGEDVVDQVAYEKAHAGL